MPFWKGRGLGSGLRTLPLGRDRWGRYSTKGGYIPNPYGRDLGLGYRVRPPSLRKRGTGESKKAQSDTAMGNKNNFFQKLIGVTTCNIVVTLYW